jgi:hypothetical protein
MWGMLREVLLREELREVLLREELREVLLRAVLRVVLREVLRRLMAKQREGVRWWVRVVQKVLAAAVAAVKEAPC